MLGLKSAKYGVTVKLGPPRGERSDVSTLIERRSVGVPGSLKVDFRLCLDMSDSVARFRLMRGVWSAHSPHVDAPPRGARAPVLNDDARCFGCVGRRSLAPRVRVAYRAFGVSLPLDRGRVGMLFM